MNDIVFSGELTVFTAKRLIDAGIDTKEKLENTSEENLLKIFGSRTMLEIDHYLGRVSLKRQKRINAAIRYIEKNGYRVEKI
jgi:hypothetical protein